MAEPNSNTTGCYGYLYSLGNASLPGPGTYNVAVHFTFPVNAASIASMASNVNQSTPFGAVATNLNGPPATSIEATAMSCGPGLILDMVVQDWLGEPGWVSGPQQNQRGHEIYNQGKSAITISDRSFLGGGPASMSGYASPMLGQALAQLAVALQP